MTARVVIGIVAISPAVAGSRFPIWTQPMMIRFVMRSFSKNGMFSPLDPEYNRCGELLPHSFDNRHSFRYCDAMHEFLVANGYPALFLLSLLASTLIPLGSEWLLVALLLKGFAPFPVLLVASVGNILGACITYFIGIYGSSFLTSKVLRMDEDDCARAERFFARYGSLSLLVSWLPVIGDPLCLIAGMMRVAFGRFAILVATGKVARYAAVAWATVEGKQLFF